MVRAVADARIRLAGLTGQAVVPVVPTVDLTLRGGWGYRTYDRFEFEPDRDEFIWRAGGELRKWFTPWFSAGVEQAGFYHFSTPDEGFGGRSVASLDFTFGDKHIRPHVGGNFGYLYGEGIDDDFIAGPEIGITADGILAKIAYDMPFNRDADEGIINTTIGFSF